MHLSRATRATLRSPFTWHPPIIKAPLREKLESLNAVGPITSDWGFDHLRLFHIQFLAANPDNISTRYGSAPLTEDGKQLLGPPASQTSSLVRSISHWLSTVQEYKDQPGDQHEASVDHFAGRVLEACDATGGHSAILPQQRYRQSITGFNFVAKPDFILQDCEDNRIHLVTHHSKGPKVADKAWPQVGGGMLLTAMRNMREPSHHPKESFRLFGLRVMGTSFTFFRCDFEVEKLLRLDSGLLSDDDTFDIHAWAGERVDRYNDSAEGRWGLDFLVPSERKQILDMIAAIAEDIKETRAT